MINTADFLVFDEGFDLLCLPDYGAMDAPPVYKYGVV